LDAGVLLGVTATSSVFCPAEGDAASTRCLLRQAATATAATTPTAAITAATTLAVNPTLDVTGLSTNSDALRAGSCVVEFEVVGADAAGETAGAEVEVGVGGTAEGAGVTSFCVGAGVTLVSELVGAGVT
jgi:hypothetical protein